MNVFCFVLTLSILSLGGFKDEHFSCFPTSCQTGLSPGLKFSATFFLVGTSGIIPLILIPQTAQDNKNSTNKEKEEKTSQEKKTLNRQLSFAVGGLLGDVFLHLLPESYENGKDFYLSNFYRH